MLECLLEGFSCYVAAITFKNFYFFNYIYFGFSFSSAIFFFIHPFSVSLLGYGKDHLVFGHVVFSPLSSFNLILFILFSLYLGFFFCLLGKCCFLRTTSNDGCVTGRAYVFWKGLYLNKYFICWCFKFCFKKQPTNQPLPPQNKQKTPNPNKKPS